MSWINPLADERPRPDMQLAIERYLKAKVAVDWCDRTYRVKNQISKSADAQLAHAKREVARLADVPPDYVDDIELQVNDRIDIYFGGVDGPLGEKHAHFIFTLDCVLKLARPPGILRPRVKKYV